jgi:undecaprenyl diphosphate synthase
MNTPSHVAIIMDGNGRWAQARNRPRVFGHLRGAKVAKNIITSAVNCNIRQLTLFTFSTENWARPADEIEFLMRLLGRQLLREANLLLKKNVRFQIVGDLTKLPSALQTVVRDIVELTKNNSGMILTFALNYGGRQEIAKAAKKLAQLAVRGTLKPEDIDESTFGAALESSELPDPDLIIRTSGENRLSNFMLWQAAYSEFFISSTLWPDYTVEEFERTLLHFSSRQRRFGKVHTKEPRGIST